MSNTSTKSVWLKDLNLLHDTAGQPKYNWNPITFIDPEKEALKQRIIELQNQLKTQAEVFSNTIKELTREHQADD